MIDLHMHTNVSDGRLAPAELVARVQGAAITVMSVTDHDTVAALPDVRRLASAADIDLIDGIEVTAVDQGRDVHILGYFIDVADEALASLLEKQRASRVDRVREICVRLSALGAPVDADAVIASTRHHRDASVGRPAIASALVSAGYVTSIAEAFDRFLGAGQPAFVARMGPAPAAVVAAIQRAGGVASMAHPGVTNRPEVLSALVDAGLDAVEAYHSDHTLDTREALIGFAADHGLLVTGGSDFHGDHGRPLGGVTLPPSELERLRARAGERRTR
jgi:hypothetical protein